MSGLAATGGAEHAERVPLRAHAPDTYWPPFCAVVDFLTAAAILTGIAT